MALLGIVLAAALARPLAPEPVLWLHPSGKLYVAGREVPGRLNKGAKSVRTPVGFGLDFAGGSSGFLIPDYPALKLSRNITVSAWVYLRKYTANGWQSQIFFRGDDRGGLDPYYLKIGDDGKVGFAINGADGGESIATADMPLKSWVRVTGVLDEDANEIRIYLGNRLVSTTETQRHPIVNLDAKSAPGLGIGNVQNDTGGNNQPLDGIVADLRVYDVVLKPAEAGYAPLPATAG